MPDSPVLDWTRIIHKNVRSHEGEPVGNVSMDADDSIVIVTQGAMDRYIIPKSKVEAFDGAEVRLSLIRGELDRYRL